ncbi:MAG: hypothetical protein IKG23_06320 [Clostridia bacterium]|nr:hypothetical protein [Clostridia bacterium]
MKNRGIRMLSLLTALLLALPTAGMIPAAAAEGEGEEIFPENSIVEMPETELSLGEPDECATPINELDLVEGDEEEGSSDPLEGEELSLGAADDFEPDEGSLSPTWEGDDTLSAGNNLSGAKLTASHTSMSIKVGNTSTATFGVSNFTGFFYLEVLTNNKTAYTTAWGTWKSTTKIALKITAKKAGSGKITVRLRAPNDSKIYATAVINITVPQAEKGTLKLSATSSKIELGSTYKLKVTVSDCNVGAYLTYSNSNSSAASLQWGSWSGSTIPVNIKGNKVGKGTVTVKLISSSSGKVLNTKKFTYQVYKKETPTITFSPASVSIQAGSSKKVNVTASGYSGSYYLQYSTSNGSCFSISWGSWSGNTIPMTVKGVNKGSGSITIYMKDSAGSELARKTITVTVSEAAKTPSLTLSSTSASINTGGSKSITCGYANVSDTVYLSYSTTNTTAYTCSWGSWSNHKIPLTITGKAKGSGTVTVYLMRSSDKKQLASKKISVSVSQTQSGLTFTKVAYPFSNYGTTIPLSTCQMMYGKTQTAQQVYNMKIGNGGCCYGFASTSSILSVNNSINPNTFRSGAVNVSSIQKNDYSSGLGIRAYQFIEGMQISQICSAATKTANNLNSLVSAVKTETAAGRPVPIGVWGYYYGEAGHELLAFGYSETSSACSIRVYDCNYPNAQRTLTVKKSGSSYTSWSYPFTDSITWGTGRSYAYINYIKYSTVLSNWNNRGKLKTGYGSTNSNMIVSRDNNFSLYDFNNNLVARYQNGNLTSHASGVEEVRWTDTLLSGQNADHPHVLFVPQDYYTVKNDQGGTLNVTIVDEMLSTTVTTNAEEFGFCADDASGTANATLTPLENMEFSIVIGSSYSGDPAETKLEGLGTGEPISMELSNGTLSVTGEGVSTLSRTNMETEYFISAAAGPGGSVSPDGLTSYAEGSGATYIFTPDPGYVVRAVYVDGENVGSMMEYTFENITDSHTIDVEFAGDISKCTVELSQNVMTYTGEEREPDVTVTAPDGQVLVPNVDYDLYFEDNTDVGTATVYVIGAAGSAWYGIAQETFDIVEEENAIVNVEYTAATDSVQVRTTHGGAVRLMVAAYTDENRMLAVRILDLGVEEYEATVSFSEISVSEGTRIRVFMIDSNYQPLCRSYMIRVN